MLYKSDNDLEFVLYFVHFYFLFCSISTLKVFLTIVDVAIFQSDSYNIGRILLSWIFIICNNNFSYSNSFKKNLESEVFNMVQHGLLGRLLFCLSCQEVHPFKRTLPRQQNMNVRWFNLPQNGMMSQG